ncbi:MAG: hypothetical protein ACYS4W_14125 [Planctomycetota bacterium]
MGDSAIWELPDTFSSLTAPIRQFDWPDGSRREDEIRDAAVEPQMHADARRSQLKTKHSTLKTPCPIPITNSQMLNWAGPPMHADGRRFQLKTKHSTLKTPCPIPVTKSQMLNWMEPPMHADARRY